MQPDDAVARIKALEALARATRAWVIAAAHVPAAVYNAFATLDALALPAAQPEPAGEVVEVRAAVIFYSPHDWMVRGEAGWDQKDMEEEARSRGRPLTAILSGRVSYPPTIPTIPARVATGGGS